MATPKLGALVSRCRKPIFTAAEDVAQTVGALLDLTLYMDARETRECLVPLKKLARHSPETLQAAWDTSDVNPEIALDGRRLAVVSRTIPTFKSAVTAALWSRVVSTTARAFQAAVWTPAHLKVIVHHIHRFSTYDAAFVECVARYLGATLPNATADDLPALVSIVTSLPELTSHPAKLLDAAGERAAVMAELLTPGAIGHICGQFNRTLHSNENAAIAFQEEAGRCAENGDTFTAIQLMCFAGRHKPAIVSGESLVWLMERVTGEALDARSLEQLCNAVAHLPSSVRAPLQQELLEFVTYVAVQARELLQEVPVAQGGLRGCEDAETMQLAASHILELCAVSQVLSSEQCPPEVLAAADACAASVESLQEVLLSAESSPFGLMVRLLEAPSSECKRVGLAMLREAAQQCFTFPALQTFRFLLLMGDHSLRDARTARYLRDQFAKTAADVPPVQMSVALRCLAVATAAAPHRGLPVTGDMQSSAPAAASGDVDEDVDADQERERLEAFLQFCTEVTRKHLSFGAPVCCVLDTTAHLHQLGCRDAVFFADVAAYLATRRVAASAERESAATAAAVSVALGEAVLDEYPVAREFLSDVVRRGAKEDPAMTPTKWMNLHDPANAIMPLTEQQQECWDIVEEMVRTRADDVTTLVALAERYVALLPFARPDDHKYFFGVFEEKVLKQDKLLKTCLDAIIASGELPRLSAQTIGSMLHSLAALRFDYFASVKRFMSSISDEQWATMEAAPLVHVLSGLCKLSLRAPVLLNRAGGRLMELCRFLTPLDTARAIYALQSLGHNDPALLAKLAAHAAASARLFNEPSMTLLFNVPSIQRVLSAPEVARPLLLQASTKLTSSRQREKISVWVRRSGLPRELIEESTKRLQLTDRRVERAEPRLHLT
ncbi:mitochondrial RNA binding complex 1 subunit [Novymonas esmeraldas]|uniref:Mitochondrial RNA binding complex 1 subunit n=1 Tax=Novymonas esmeraldas TaxID=1808958 RepID=A0AAW0F5Z9_9TRYP